MIRNRLLRAALVVLFAIGGGAFVVASPAMADATCPASSYLCMWMGANYTGTKLATNLSAGQFCQDVTGANDDNITAIKLSASPTSNDWNMYFGHGCTGSFIQYSNGTQIPDLAAGADNVFSSFQRA